MKIEGPQEIPSELLNAYKATLTEKGDNTFCKKRSPFKLEQMSNKGAHVRDAQLTQRERFVSGVNEFAQQSPTSRARWYSRMPEWNSFLWYYNYFMLEALGAVIGADGKVEAVIKSIQIVKESIPTTGGKSFAINAVDATRTIVLPYGNSFISNFAQAGNDVVLENDTKAIVLGTEVDATLCDVLINGQLGFIDVSGEGETVTPYLVSLTNTTLTVGLQATSFIASVPFSWQVIERKAQTIFPIPLTIATNAVTVDWSKEPSVAADVSIIVVEYI